LIPVLWFGGCVAVSAYQTHQIEQEAAERAEAAHQQQAQHQAFLDSLPAAITWTSKGLACADGWVSPSLGKQGACSHHGGEVRVYEGSNGSELRCKVGVPPDGEDAQYEQRTSAIWPEHYWCT